MPDLVGKFNRMGPAAPRSGNLLWRGRITPAPDVGWKRVFAEHLAVENTLSNPPHTSQVRFDGEVIEFAVPEVMAEAVASVIRRVIQKTNVEAGKREAQRQERNEAQRKQEEAEEQRLREKYKDGI